MTQNEPLTGVKPQSHQSLTEFLAANSCEIFDMAQMPNKLQRGLSKGNVKKKNSLSHFDRFGIVFMKAHEGQRDMNTKKINMGTITWVFFERVCLNVCACAIHIHTV